MKLFAYYALHSFKNQLKKLLKTWVLIFLLACMVLGGLIGYGAAVLSDAAEENEAAAAEDISPETEGEVPEEPALEAADSPLADLGLQTADMIELIAGAVILVLFVFEIVSADKNGSKIFLPADVNLLFASPMQPQSVLMFRLATQLGVALAASVYLVFQLPNLMFNVGLSGWAALAVIFTWCFTVAIGKLIQVLLYTLSSTKPGLKPWLRKGVYLLLALVLAAYVLYWKQSGLDYLPAAAGLFNHPATRWIPLWGWLKGFCMYAVEGNLVLCLVCLALVLLGGAALGWLIWHVKADFYEDAMAKSEETAALLEQAQSEKSTGIVRRRKKDRSDRLKRDGMTRGAGANVYFHKAMYNRFRFAHFGFLTKTMETYLVAALGVSLLCRLVIHTDSLIPAALVLAGLSFFRTLGNPLEQDTSMDYFLLIPESTWAKLFWSLMGGTVNCLLDLLPGMVLAVLLLPASPLQALAWVLFIVSIDFYATTVGTFIHLSVPVSAGKTVKQIVQVMFIYFGLLPDIALIAVGLVYDRLVPFALGAALLNLALGLIFFALAPLFIDPRGGKAAAGESGVDVKAAKGQFSRAGLSVATVLILGSILQLVVLALLNAAWPDWSDHGWVIWAATFAPIYLVAVPVGLLLLKKVPARTLPGQSLGVGRCVAVFIICVFMMYAGNLVGTLVTGLLQTLLGLESINPVASYAMDDSLAWKVLVMVILAPVIEEFLFRKQLIDRMHPYGEKLAVITSAAMFGLFHGNLSQLFYAFALGLVFGYVYLRTGRLRYSIGLHMFINLLGSVVGPALLELADGSSLEALDSLDFSAGFDPSSLLTPGNLALGAYVLAMVALAIAGLVLLILRSRQVVFQPAPLELPKGSGFKTVWLNGGMLLLLAGTLALIVLSVLGGV